MAPTTREPFGTYETSKNPGLEDWYADCISSQKKAWLMGIVGMWLGGHMAQDRRFFWALIVTGSLLLSGCPAVNKGRADLDLGMKERGIASWYGDDFHGSRW